MTVIVIILAVVLLAFGYSFFMLCLGPPSQTTTPNDRNHPYHRVPYRPCLSHREHMSADKAIKVCLLLEEAVRDIVEGVAEDVVAVLFVVIIAGIFLPVVCIFDPEHYAVKRARNK